jgi:hypothetical protein
MTSAAPIAGGAYVRSCRGFNDHFAEFAAITDGVRRLKSEAGFAFSECGHQQPLDSKLPKQTVSFTIGMPFRRGGRVAEGGGLLNRYRG